MTEIVTTPSGTRIVIKAVDLDGVVAAPPSVYTYNERIWEARFEESLDVTEVGYGRNHSDAVIDLLRQVRRTHPLRRT